MKNSRQENINLFNNFYNNAQEIFNKYEQQSPKIDILKNRYNLYIRPGGKNGGFDTKTIDVFFGKRPIGSNQEINNNGEITRRLEVEQGATLHYQRLDDGGILCFLYPAKTENMSPKEDLIILQKIYKPHNLQKISHKHWKYFIAYMEVTSLDGQPTLWQKFLVGYLRFVKHLIIKQAISERKIFTNIKEIFKYVMTIGISGFLLLIITTYKENITSNEDYIYKQDLLKIIKDNAINTQNISNTSIENLKQIIEIKESTKTTNQNLQTINTQLEEIVDQKNQTD